MRMLRACLQIALGLILTIPASALIWLYFSSYTYGSRGFGTLFGIIALVGLLLALSGVRSFLATDGGHGSRVDPLDRC
jgi:hypothetical protein